MTTAPPAHADEFDWIVDLVDPLLGIPVGDSGVSDTFDLGTWLDPSTWGAASYDQFIYEPMHEGIEDWINSPLGTQVDGFINSLSGQFLIGDGADGTALHPDGGDGGDGAAAGIGGLGGWLDGTPGAAGTGAPASATVPLDTTVPLRLEAGTEPVVDISIGGGPSVPVLVDTGSEGLVVPWWDIGWQDLGWPTGLGVGAYSGGLYYFYVTLPTTVDFGNDIVTGQTGVNAVLFTFPGSISGFLAGSADGVLGIGPNAAGPGPSSVITALPDPLDDGVLIDIPGDQLVFGPNPLADGVSVAGSPSASLYVQVDDGPLQRVPVTVDSGGVYGTIPSSLLGTGQTSGTVPAGTEISVYTSDGQPLYSYTTDATNGPTVTSGSTMNSGYMPFWLYPVYISNSPSGLGTTTIGV